MENPIVSHSQPMKASKVFGRMAECYRMLEEAGLCFEDLQRPITDADFRKRLVAFWKGDDVKKFTHADSTFPITVDHTLSRQEMIQAGNYDWINDDVTEKHFSRDKKEGKEKVDLELIHFNKRMSSEAVLSELKERGYRPATLSELLAFGSTYKEEQRKYPIIALGSVWQSWDGDRRVPVLWSYSGGRDLDLDWFEDDWSEGYRFLAVREV